MRERRLGDIEQPHQLARAQLAGVLGEHVDQLHADRVRQCLGIGGQPRRALSVERRARRANRGRCARRTLALWHEDGFHGAHATAAASSSRTLSTDGTRRVTSTRPSRASAGVPIMPMRAICAESCTLSTGVSSPSCATAARLVR